MQLPETSDLLLPMLELLSNGEECHLQELATKLAQVFEFSQSGEIKDRTLDAQFYSRVVGTRSYLTHACLIESPKRGVSKISQRGQELLAQNPESLTMKSLTRYPEFLNYLKTSTSENLADFITPENQNEFAEMNQKNRKVKSNGHSNGGKSNASAPEKVSAPEVKATVAPIIEPAPEPKAEDPADDGADDLVDLTAAVEETNLTPEIDSETDTVEQVVPQPEPVQLIDTIIEKEEEEEPPIHKIDEIKNVKPDEHLTPPANPPAIDVSEINEPERLGISGLIVDTPVVDFIDNTMSITPENKPADEKVKEIVENIFEEKVPEVDVHASIEPEPVPAPEVQVAKVVAPAPQTESTPNSATVGSRNTVLVSQENFASSLELMEQLRLASQFSQAVPQQLSAPKTNDLEKLSPARFTILALMRFLENWFQHFWLYLIPFILMLGAYVASLFILSDEFVSKGVLFVQTDTLINQVASLGDDNVDFFLAPSQQTADEINELLNTDSFIRLIITQTPLEAEMAKGDKVVRETIADVRESIAVNITGSNNVEVLASWDDQQIAWKTATAAMNSYIEWKINSDKRDIFGAREFLEQLVPQYENEYRGSVQALEEYLIQHPEPFRGDRPEIEQLQINQLEVASQTSFDRYQEASDNLEQIRLEEVITEGKTRQSYTIVDSPKIPVEEEGGLVRKIVTAAVFLTLGAVLSILAIIASTLLDRSVRFPMESPSAVGLPVLSNVNMVKNFDELSLNATEAQE